MRISCLALLLLCVEFVSSCTILIVNNQSVTNLTLPSILRNFPGCASTSVLNITIIGANLPMISEDTFTGLTTLRTIRISNSNMAVVPPLLLRNLNALSYLSLSNNLLANLPGGFLDGNFNLATAIFSNNRLTSIAYQAFCCGAPVVTLDLSFNNLTGFVPGAFNGLTSLSTLYWNSNNLQAENVHTGLLSGSPISFVNVSGNPGLESLPKTLFSGVSYGNLVMDSKVNCGLLGLLCGSTCTSCGGTPCCYYWTQPTASPTNFPTMRPTTSSPTSLSPTSVPTTSSPTTLSPTLSPASTFSPSTVSPTQFPTTEAPTNAPTSAPSTYAPTTGAPSTAVPTLIIATLTDEQQQALPVWVWGVIAAAGLGIVVFLIALWVRRRKHLERRAFIASESAGNSDSSTSGLADSPSHSKGTRGPEDSTVSRPISRDVSTRHIGTLIEIDGKELDIGPKLGNGAFGSVNQCLWRGTDYAMKSLLKPSQEAAFEKEVEVNRQLSALPHTHVTRMVGVSRNPAGIVMELYPMGCVEEFLRKNLLRPDDFSIILTILITASAGVMHLHTQGIIHRDIAARNFLVKKDFSAAVCDFGLAVALPEGKTVGTRTAQEREGDLLPINITAPETLSLGQYSAASDVFMFGMLIWEVLTRQVPHGKRPEFSSSPKDFVGFIQRVIHEDLRPEIPDDWPPTLKLLVAQCWERKPELRPTLSQINHTLRNVRAEVAAAQVSLPAVVKANDAKAAPIVDPNLYYTHVYSNVEEVQAGPLYQSQSPALYQSQGPPPPYQSPSHASAAHYSPGAMYRPYSPPPADV